jgi:hypothetical protein
VLVLMLSTGSFRLCEAHIEGGPTGPICPGPWPKETPSILLLNLINYNKDVEIKFN